MNKKLYRVVIKVRPMPAHPKYFEFQFGVLSLWLYAESAGVAADSAIAIANELPYERVDGQMRIDNTASYLAAPSAEGFAPDLVKHTGLAVCFTGCETGSDEAIFEELLLE